MIRRYIIIVVLILIGIVGGAQSFGAGVIIQNKQRIVSLKPNVTDIIVALGAGDRLVGVTRYCDRSQLAKDVAIAADYTAPLLERIVALHPDLIIGSKENTSRRAVDELQKMGLKVMLFQFDDLTSTLESIREIGVLIDKKEEAVKESNLISANIAAISKRFKKTPKKKIVVVWGIKPMIVAGGGTYMDWMFDAVGAENIFARMGSSYPRVGLEELIAADPDVIVDLSVGMESKSSIGRPWDGVEALRSVREKRVVAIDASIFRAGPKMVEGLKRLAEEIHR